MPVKNKSIAIVGGGPGGLIGDTQLNILGKSFYKSTLPRSILNDNVLI